MRYIILGILWVSIILTISFEYTTLGCILLGITGLYMLGLFFFDKDLLDEYHDKNFQNRR